MSTTLLHMSSVEYTPPYSTHCNQGTSCRRLQHLFFDQLRQHPSRSVNGFTVPVREGSHSWGHEAFPGQNMVIIGDMPFIQTAIHVLQAYSNANPRKRETRDGGTHIYIEGSSRQPQEGVSS